MVKHELTGEESNHPFQSNVTTVEMPFLAGVAARQYMWLNTHRKTLPRTYVDDAPEALPFKQLLSGSRIRLSIPEVQDDVPIEPNHMDLLEKIGCLLYFTNGILRKELYHPYPYHRSFPSPRALYATELYLLVREHYAEWRAYHYSPSHHRLELAQIDISVDWPTKVFGRSHIDCEVMIVLTTDWWRIASIYSDFAYRLCTLEAGHALGSIVEMAAALGWQVTVETQFADVELAHCVGVDVVAEAPLAVLFLTGSGDEGAVTESLTGVVEPEHEDSVTCQWRSPSGVRTQQCRWIRKLEAASFIDEKAIRQMVETSSVQQPAGFGPVGSVHRTVYRFLHRNSGHGPYGLHPKRSELHRPDWEYLCEVVGKALQSWTLLSHDKSYLSLYTVSTNVQGASGVFRISETGTLTPIKDIDAARILQEGFGGHDINFDGIPACWFIAADLGRYIAQYGDRGVRIMHMHAGFVMQSLLLTCAELGLFARPMLSFDEALSECLLNISGTEIALMEQVIVGRDRYLGWQLSTTPSISAVKPETTHSTCRGEGH